MVETSFLVLRANLRGADAIILRFDDSPGGGATRGKKNVSWRRRVFKRLRRRSIARFECSSRSAHYSNRHHRKDGPPVAPARDLN